MAIAAWELLHSAPYRGAEMTDSQHTYPSAHAPLILVVEDEVLISLDLETGLRDAGFTVAAARSCVEATEFLNANRPDAAIVDVQLTDGECIPCGRTSGCSWPAICR
jgi:ActR/RegA family two-component response regulator